MAPLTFLEDEHVKRAYVVALRNNGFDVGAVGETYRGGISDEEFLDRCRQASRIVLTNDDDFARLARRYDHPGVILYSDQGHSPGAFVRGIARIDRFLDEDAMQNHIEWPENWL